MNYKLDTVSDDFLSTMGAKRATSEYQHVAAAEESFYIRARRNKLLAQWVCHTTNRSIDSAKYLIELIDADLDHGIDDNLMIQKITSDLKLFGVHYSNDEMRKLLSSFELQARLEKIPGHPMAKEPRES